jgi:hypothetical protein
MVYMYNLPIPEGPMDAAGGVGGVTALALLARHAEAPGEMVVAAAVVVVVMTVVVAALLLVRQRAAAVVGRRRYEQVTTGTDHTAAGKGGGVLGRRVALYENGLAGSVAEAPF